MGTAANLAPGVFKAFIDSNDYFHQYRNFTDYFAKIPCLYNDLHASPCSPQQAPLRAQWPMPRRRKSTPSPMKTSG